MVTGKDVMNSELVSVLVLGHNEDVVRLMCVGLDREERESKASGKPKLYRLFVIKGAHGWPQLIHALKTYGRDYTYLPIDLAEALTTAVDQIVVMDKRHDGISNEHWWVEVQHNDETDLPDLVWEHVYKDGGIRALWLGDLRVVWLD